MNEELDVENLDLTIVTPPSSSPKGLVTRRAEDYDDGSDVELPDGITQIMVGVKAYMLARKEGISIDTLDNTQLARYFNDALRELCIEMKIRHDPRLGRATAHNQAYQGP